MNQQQLTAFLASVTGQLHPANKTEESAVEEVEKSIAGVLMQQEPASVTNRDFTFSRSDLFSGERNLPENRLKKLEKVVADARQAKKDVDQRLFVRDIPVRTTQLAGSTPIFAAGARVVNTIGPVRSADGRTIFIDFFKVEKSIALYFHGQTLPAILFNAQFRRGTILLPNGIRVELTNRYTVIPTSVWINARLLNPSAPVDFYCGLRVKGGTIQLTAAPQFINNQLVIAHTSQVAVHLELEQTSSAGEDATSPYGEDARAAEFHLPDTFDFRFTATTKTIQTVAPSKWTVYGQPAAFTYNGAQNTVFNTFINRLAIPVTCDAPQITIRDCKSPFMQLSGRAAVKAAWWALPTAKLDVANPLEAGGNGALIVECATGLQAQWTSLENNVFALGNPFIMGEPGRIDVTDQQSNGSGALQRFSLWKDEVNAFGTSVDLFYTKQSSFIFNTLSKGDEALMALANADFKIDRPVKVNGEAIAVQSKSSLLFLGATKLKHSVYLYDDNILWDNKLPNDKIPMVKPFALALHNALFTVTPPNGAALFGECDAQFKQINQGSLFLTFGLFSYLPTLPDPYTANLGELRRQFEHRTGSRITAGKKTSVVWLWLIGRIKWMEREKEPDKVGVSFHFAPLQQAVQIGKIEEEEKENPEKPVVANPHPILQPPGRLEGRPDFPSAILASEELSANMGTTARLATNLPAEKVQILTMMSQDMFTLLDVSSKANQMGVSFSVYGQQLRGETNFMVNTNAAGTAASVFPIQVQGMDVVSAGRNVRAFALPQIAWEPLYNFTAPAIAKDPPYGFNYYPNDGIATRIGNLSNEPITLSPIPLSKYLVQTYQSKNDNRTYAIFNLPFGMIAFSILNQQSTQLKKADIESVQPVFHNYINGGIQLELTAGSSNNIGEDNLFEGFTLQLENVADAAGNPTNTSTLGDSVTQIFNGEFFTPSITSFETQSRSAVPVKRIGLSGYGASMFSNWINKEAAFAQTSQALFNVTVGRTGHEVIQVVSMIYPWGIRVVRTITIFRLSNGYVGRVDSGWKAESEGKFDFSYTVQAFKQGTGNDPAQKKKFALNNPYIIHPGTNHGLYNIRNIREIETTFKSSFQVNTYTYEYDNANNLIPIPAADPPVFEELRGLTFDADVRLENVTEGGVKIQGDTLTSLVPSKGILGFVQLSPRGVPITVQSFKELLESQNGTIGGPINCTIKVAGTAQRMQLNRFDVNNSVNEAAAPLFVGAARGSVILPKDGSWSLVMHSRGSGDVSPLPESLSVPLVRMGQWVKDKVVNPADIASQLQRIAHPQDLVRLPVPDTINFGFLQNLPTQKVLFLTPAFSSAQQYLLSKTPPLLADSYRLLNSKGIFPNIGTAEGVDFGTAIQLLKGVDDAFNPKEAFADSGLLDGGKKALQLLEIKAKEEGQKLLDQGYKLVKDKANDLANEAFKFDLPSFEYPLVELKDTLKIYIEYKASTNNEQLPKKDYVGKFDFNVDSFASDMAKTWKGRMHNMAMVIDLGPLKRLMTIQGNFNSQKGKETDLGSKDPGDNEGFTLPTPEIKFSDAVEPVIQILEILAQLSQGNYANALKKGLKVAMSNSANIWEYKFEATKDIPLVRFPPGPAYEAPQTPLKLEASMALGVYFNAALKITTDPKQLLPTAGAFFQFHGGLQVMCVSVGVGTIYAVGHVDLKLAADTSPLISLTMKFGFGAQIGVGLPVIATVSVLFMVGVEIYADSSQKVVATAILLFRGHAEILGGLVGVTITIEARGSIEKSGKDSPTNCKAQVTFALDISIFMVIDISFSESWEEQRQIA
ncbi:hypothetical protein HRH25_09600 [Flavisolibacter sp. BT320]|nr:hypothetical protein [Flavisolibacter longurius]